MAPHGSRRKTARPLAHRASEDGPRERRPGSFGTLSLCPEPRKPCRVRAETSVPAASAPAFGHPGSAALPRTAVAPGHWPFPECDVRRTEARPTPPAVGLFWRTRISCRHWHSAFRPPKLRACRSGSSGHLPKDGRGAPPPVMGRISTAGRHTRCRRGTETVNGPRGRLRGSSTAPPFKDPGVCAVGGPRAGVRDTSRPDHSRCAALFSLRGPLQFSPSAACRSPRPFAEVADAA